jgi:hypothetical protein
VALCFRADLMAYYDAVQRPYIRIITTTRQVELSSDHISGSSGLRTTVAIVNVKIHCR